MLSAASAPPRLSTLILLTALSVLSLNMHLPSLPAIARDLQADYALVNLSIAGYLAITGVLQLVMGPLSDRYGRRPVLLVGLLIFIAASIGCALAEDIESFLVFRLLQGAVISGTALSRAVIRDMVPPQEAATRMGHVAMAMAIAPMLGPMFGGALTELFGWRANFYAFAGFGVLVFWLCWADLGETHLQRSATFLKQFRSYPALLGSRLFWSYSLCLTFAVGGFHVFLASAPIVAEHALNLSPAELGVGIGSITAGFFVGNFLSGRLVKRHSLSTMMIAGRWVGILGLSAGLAILFAGHLNVYTLFGAVVFVGLGNGLTLPSANAGALSVEPKLAGSAAGLSGAMTVGGGALLTVLVGETLNAGNAPAMLLGLLLMCSVVSLAAAQLVRRGERSIG